MSFPKATGQCALHEPVAAEVIPILDDPVSLLRRLFLGRTAYITYTIWVVNKKKTFVGRKKSWENTYPMNHAPLAACVPFCRQARKWCPPAKLSQHVPQTGKYNCLARYCSGVLSFPSPRSALCMLPKCSPRHSNEYPIDLQCTQQKGHAWRGGLIKITKKATWRASCVLLCVLAEAVFGEHEGIG